MRSLLYHPATIFVLSIAAVVFYVSLYRTEQKIQTSTETIGVLDQEVEQISSEVKELEHKLQVATSAATREKIIRDELLMQKPGEYVVQMPALEEIAKLEEQANQQNQPQTPWQAWQEVLF